MAKKEQFLDFEEARINADVARASELLDRISILAVQAILYQEESISGINQVYNKIYPEANDIGQELRTMTKLRYRFAGRGFVPIQTSGLPVRTTFAKVDDNYGRFYELALLDADDIEYLDREEILVEAGVYEDENDDDDYDDESTDLFGVSEYTKQTLDHIVSPGVGTRLYIDFLTARSVDEQAVGGIAVRSNDVRTHNVMDAESLNISFIYGQKESYDAVPIEKVHETMNEGSEELKRAISNTKFRRMGHAQQQKLLENLIARINDRVRIDRFNALISPEHLYTMRLGGGNRELYLRSIAQNRPEMTVRPIRLDSIELYDVTEGQRIFSDKCLYGKYDGLCIVAEVDFLNKSEIIWLPISSQDAEITLFNKDVET